MSSSSSVASPRQVTATRLTATPSQTTTTAVSVMPEQIPGFRSFAVIALLEELDDVSGTVTAAAEPFSLVEPAKRTSPATRRTASAFIIAPEAYAASS